MLDGCGKIRYPIIIIDRDQYGSRKESSTTHCLVEMLHEFKKVSDKPDTIGNLIVTDFSKALVSIDHTIVITKLIKLGVRREIIP